MHWFIRRTDQRHSQDALRAHLPVHTNSVSTICRSTLQESSSARRQGLKVIQESAGKENLLVGNERPVIEVCIYEYSDILLLTTFVE